MSSEMLRTNRRMRRKNFLKQLDFCQLFHNDPSKPTIQDLPDEILLKIFSFLDQEVLVNSVSKVCLRWEELHTDKSLYRKVVFRKSKDETEMAVSIIKMAPWLTSLELVGRTDSNAILEHVGTHHPLLEKLMIIDCRGSDQIWQISSKHMENIIEHCKKLTHISLKGSFCFSSKFYNEVGIKLPLLRVFDTGDACDSFNTDSFTNLVVHLDAMEELHVHANWMICSEMITAFCEKFQKSLRILELKCKTRWTDSSLESLTNCRHLTELRLYNCENITDQGLMVMEDMNELTEIVMWGGKQITADGWTQFVMKPFMKDVKRLTLSYCDRLDDAAGLYIVKNLWHLCLLDLSGWNSMTTKGRRRVAQATRPGCNYNV